MPTHVTISNYFNELKEIEIKTFSEKLEWDNDETLCMAVAGIENLWNIIYGKFS